MRIYFYILVLTFLVSCSVGSHSNFNKQKYTDLKPVQNTDYVQANDELINNQKSYIDFEEGTNFNDEINLHSENSDEYTVTQSGEPIEETFIESEVESTEDQEQTKPVMKHGGNPKDFEKLSDEEKQQALTSFNRIFNNGLILFLFGILLALGSFSAFFLLIGTAFFVFVVWIMSFVALNKVRRINVHNQQVSMMHKIRLAQIVCGIGVAVCIITILGGIVLGILLLAKVI
ncbi:MAG: hypothetical protein IPM77_14340 [Crocinitomicaceae bacterium]|nr:hypothetical protein [Crocinitomicaceae bacterium]